MEKQKRNGAAGIGAGDLDGHRRCCVHRNRPAEAMLAALPIQRRQVAYLVLICLIWVGYILQSGGFGGTAGFGMYANF